MITEPIYDIVFGIIAAWIGNSIQKRTLDRKFKTILVIGFVSGIVASLTGYIGGWSDWELFNFYNVIIAISFLFPPV